MGNILLSVGFAGALETYLPSTGRELPVKQAHIEPKLAKEELKPFKTNFGTRQRAIE
jgi:hypothetical protein